MTAPAGAIVRLYVDTRLPLEVGDGIVTGTGRRYEVLELRVQERGKWAGIRPPSRRARHARRRA